MCIEQTFSKSVSKAFHRQHIGAVTNNEIFLLYKEYKPAIMASSKQRLQAHSSANYRSTQSSRSSPGSQGSNESHGSKETTDNVLGQNEEVSPTTQKSSSSIISDFAHLRPRGGLRGKSYWRDVIDEVEFAVHCVSQPRLPIIDYSLVLPPHLRERVKQIQTYDYSTSDDVVFIRDEMREERPHDYQIASEQDSREEGQEGAALVSTISDINTLINLNILMCISFKIWAVLYS